MAELTFIIPDVVGLNSRTHARKPASAAVTDGRAQRENTLTTASRPVNQGKVLMSDREVDQQLVVRAQAGDKRAFELLVIKYQRKVERLLSRIIRNQDEIQDVAQESFIKAYRALVLND